jgi:hypothetical protein
MNNKNSPNKQLLEPSKRSQKTVDGTDVSLEQLESLCTEFDRRPRGCNAETAEPGAGFSSSGDNDDVLF